MKIEQIMTKNVISVDYNNKITEAAKIMTQKRIHGLPVTKKGKLIGIITESDFFVKGLPDMYLPSYIKFLKNSKFADAVEGKEKKEVKMILKAKAKDIMTEPCISLKSNSEIGEMMYHIKKSHIFTFPVVDNNNKLVGVVTQADIIRLI